MILVIKMRRMKDLDHDIHKNHITHSSDNILNFTK